LSRKVEILLRQRKTSSFERRKKKGRRREKEKDRNSKKKKKDGVSHGSHPIAKKKNNSIMRQPEREERAPAPLFAGAEPTYLLARERGGGKKLLWFSGNTL